MKQPHAYMFDTQEKKDIAIWIIDQVKEVVRWDDLSEASQVCESAITTLEQDLDLVQANGCTL